MSKVPVSFKTRSVRFLAGGLTLFVMIVMASVPAKTATAVASAEPDASGLYNYLQIAQDNTFRVYAVGGETIHFTIASGYKIDNNKAGYNSRLCGTLEIHNSNDPPTVVVAGARKDGVNQGGTSFTNTNIQARTSTCDSNNRPFRYVTLSYTVPDGQEITSMDNAFSVTFTGPGGSTRVNSNWMQGYKWRVTVNDNAIDPIVNKRSGRVWFVGNDAGLRIWQDGGWDTDGSRKNATNHTFQFVRKDGYRYTFSYSDYHGIWSIFHGGLYGGRYCNPLGNPLVQILTNSDGGRYGICSILGNPAYVSYFDGAGVETYRYHLNSATNDDWRHSSNTYTYATNNNAAYVFVDCDNYTNCPNGDIPASVLRSQPITSDAASVPVVLGSGVTANTFVSNPIANENNDRDGTNNFRYTNVPNPSVNSAGGTVTIPYTAMQSGYIQLTVSQGATILCQKDYLIDDAEPTDTGFITWTFNRAGLNQAYCDSGTLRNTGSEPTVDPDSVLIISAQAIHLGEMHFIDVDTEQRAGVSVTGNGLGSPTDLRSLVWNDPLSRTEDTTCGKIPPTVGPGAASYSNRTGWNSVSATNDTGLRRAGVDSSGGVHGWVELDGDNCDADDLGKAFPNGTATTRSTWGNNRVIEDWTYAFVNPPARTLRIGGPEYTLTPSVNPSGSTISPGQSATFTPRIDKNGRSTATGIHWELLKIVVPSTVGSFDQSLYNAAGPVNGCAHYIGMGGGITCSPVAGRSADGQTVSASMTLPGITDNDTAGLAVGSRLCYALLVSPYNQDGNNYSEAVSCVLVAASPYISINGGTAWAGGPSATPSSRIHASVPSTDSANSYGSTGEYGVFATGTVDHFGSAAQLNSNNTLRMVDGSRLTFANWDSLGTWTATHRISNLVTQYASATHTPAVLNSSNVVVGSGVYVTSDDVTLSGIAGNPKAVIYAPNNTVTINANITYTSTGAVSFSELPSLTVIARTIQLNGNVTEITGNFYAVNRFVTCAGGPLTTGSSPAITTNGVCRNQVIVNGAVTVANQAAGSLVLNRSYGGTTAHQAAEIIRMRPEVFLTRYEDNADSLLLSTVYETELPSRY